ncbi:MAG: cytochrome c3 family protein, partial [Proteobacteria bacterium]|nr:cytochrome c3 family protein [Pseudomonadota bacterium]
MKHRTSRVLLPTALILISLFSSALCHGYKTGIIFPTDKSFVNQPQIRVVGLSTEQDPASAIQLNNAQGNQEFAAPAVNGAFNQLITLSSGLNTLTLTGTKAPAFSIFLYTKDSGRPPKGFNPLYLHSSSELTGACDQCHPQESTNKNYTTTKQKLSCITQTCHNTIGDKKSKHGPFADRSCIECHNPHGTPFKKFTSKDRSALCFTCHSESEGMASSGKVVHFPIKQGECTLCHDPHQSNAAYHLKFDSIVELCTSCHSKSMVKYKYMHDPFESGDCNACHSPHISDFKRLLTAEGSALCLNCHEEREDEFKRKYVHEPVKKDCSLCHDPHGSDAENHLITPKDKNGNYIKYDQPLKESCLMCHRKLHPEVSKQIDKSSIPHKPVAEGKCTICHTPHSTNFKKQLNTSMQDACFGCHKELKKLIKSSKYQHGPVRTDDCAQCHQVHGSEHKELLRANFTANYSEDFDAKHYELCFNCHNSRVITDSKNIETGFRNGASNLHYVHVHREKDGRTCMTCHDIHASNQPKHIRTEIPFKKNFSITMDFSK